MQRLYRMQRCFNTNFRCMRLCSSISHAAIQNSLQARTATRKTRRLQDRMSTYALFGVAVRTQYSTERENKITKFTSRVRIMAGNHACHQASFRASSQLRSKTSASKTCYITINQILLACHFLTSSKHVKGNACADAQDLLRIVSLGCL